MMTAPLLEDETTKRNRDKCKVPTPKAVPMADMVAMVDAGEMVDAKEVAGATGGTDIQSRV